ncbi:MAG: TetR/AcrR family transcriptional regulator [Alphaproteobacteria bacterium]
MTSVVEKSAQLVGRPRKVSYEQIIAAALQVMEQDGFAALSMRSLARQLGINHATIYNYVGSIAEVEQAALDELMKQIPMPDKSCDKPMRQQLIEHMLAVHETQLLFPSFCHAPPGTRTWQLHMGCMARILDACTDSVEQIEDTAIAYNALISLAATNAERSRMSGDKTPIKPYLEAMSELTAEEYEPLFRPLRHNGGYTRRLSDFVYRLDYLIERLLPHFPALEEVTLEQIHRRFTDSRAAKQSAK